jgi:hypothetical protein
LKAPERLVIGFSKFYIYQNGRATINNKKAIITEFKISKRTKKSFTIVNENGWNRKRDKTLGKISMRNVFKTGYKICTPNEGKYSMKSNKLDWYLKHDDIDAYIPIRSLNMANLLKTAVIEAGEIKSELIYFDSKLGFVTKEYYQTLVDESENIKKRAAEKRKELQSFKVNKKDLVPGKIYKTILKTGEEEHFLFIGAANENGNPVKFIRRTVSYKSHSTNELSKFTEEYGYYRITIQPQEVNVPYFIENNMYYRHRLKEIEYNGVTLFPALTKWRNNISKTLPSVYSTDDDRNYFDMYNDELKEMIKVAVENTALL